jgi:uncharacterized SAM-binding protein YcdF (DUF218 family)
MTFFLLLFLLLLTACIAQSRWPRAGKALAITSAIAMFFWAWDPFAAAFSGSLERQFPMQPIPSGEAEAIVVLSANFYPPDASQGEVLPGYGTYLRCHHAALLYRHWKTVPVVVSAGAVESRGQLVPAAPAMRQLLENEGVPGAMIWSESQAQTTYENARYTADLLRQKGIRRIALVTEAFHMPRAYRTFQRQGFAVLPAPCAFRVARFEGGWREFLFPRPENMVVNETNLHEWVGLLWYSLSGKS